MQLFNTPQIAMVDADVQYYPNWLGISDADAFFAQLKQNLSWSQDYIRIYGRDVKIPRLQCWMGNHAATYTYSGLQMQPVGWAEPVEGGVEAGWTGRFSHRRPRFGPNAEGPI